MEGESSQVTSALTVAGVSRVRNKYMWTDEKDNMLVQEMVALFHDGTHRAESGFKPGFLNVLEAKLSPKIPGVTLTNIRSRLKTLRTQLSINKDIQLISGFGWDPLKNMVTAGRNEWDTLLKANNKFERCMKYPFPHFDDLHMIFGTTRATGDGAEDAADAEDNVTSEQDTSMDDVSMDDTSTDDTSGRSSSKDNMPRKRRNLNTESMKSLSEAVKKLGDDMITSSSVLGSKIAGPHSDMRAKLNGELEKIVDLAMVQRFKLVAYIAADTSLLEVFFSLPENQRGLFAMELVKSKGF